jgi:methylaspartate mutase sigma subunit
MAGHTTHTSPAVDNISAMVSDPESAAAGDATLPTPQGATTSLRKARTALVSSLPSDSHTWNLVFLELLLREQGYEVFNLGSCVPTGHLLEQCLRVRPDVVVLSSVNGHGHIEAKEAIAAIRSNPGLKDTAVVVGGKLGVLGERNAQFTAGLLAAGFDAVFTDSASPQQFTRYLSARASTASHELVPAERDSAYT